MSSKKRSASQSHLKNQSTKVVRAFEFEHKPDLIGNLGIKVDNKYRKGSDQTSFNVVNEKNHPKASRKSTASRFSINSVASTAHSDLY